MNNTQIGLPIRCNYYNLIVIVRRKQFYTLIENVRYYDIIKSGMRKCKLVCNFRLEQQDHEHAFRS
jgi:hypothetical protein